MKTICVAGKNDIAVNVLLHLLKFYSHEFKFVVTCNSNENWINSWQKSLRYFAKQYNVPEVKLTDLYEIADLIFISCEFDKFMKRENFEEIVENNIVAPILLTSKRLKKKKILKNGSVVFTSSIDGPSIGSIGNGIYSASKAAIEGFVKCACLEQDKQNYPLQRYGEPREIALGIVYLLSDAASWTTETSLTIDGGYTAKYIYSIYL